LTDPRFNISQSLAISNLPLSLRSSSPALSKGSVDSERASICSELNNRILFQRGGRSRSSGKSNKNKAQNFIFPNPPTFPPPVPPRKRSSQPCFLSDARNHKQFPIIPNDDYADIDEILADQGVFDAFAYENPIADVYRESTMDSITPSQSGPTCDYVEYALIDDTATMALKNLSSGRPSAKSIKRSSSMYNVYEPGPGFGRANTEYYYTIADVLPAPMITRTLSTSLLINQKGDKRKNSRNNPFFHQQMFQNIY